MFRVFYDRLDAGLLGGAASTKPRVIAEYACMPDPRRPEWLRALPAALADLPKIKAVDYFDSGSLDSLGTDAESISAFADAGRAPLLNQPHAD
jgi:hypothetical protein